MGASENIDELIAGLADWRGPALGHLRATINDADPRLSEEWKWSSPVWSYKGNVCSIGAFKTHVKVNFFKGARLEDPAGVFNAGLEARDSRSIDLAEGESVNASALQALVRAATDLNA